MQFHDLMIVFTFGRVLVTVVVAAALAACVGGSNEPAFDPAKADALPRHALPQALVSDRADMDYFPNQFPVPQGETEPLPAQF
jgi:hypothetical protein